MQHPNQYNSPSDYNFNMSSNFPSLNQANQGNTFQGSLPQGLGLQRGGSNMGFDTSGYSQPNYHRAGSGMSNTSFKTPLSTKTLSSSSKDFVPTSSMNLGFFGGSGQSNPNQNLGNFYSPQPTYQPTTTKTVQHQHSTTPPLGQMSSQMGHPQFPPNLYPQSNNPSHYMQQNPTYQQHSSYPYGGGSFMPSNYTANSSSLNTSISTDYSDNEKEFDKVIEYIANLKYPEKREEALQELSKKRESFPKLAVYLWHSVGTLAILLQEIVAIYPLLSPQTLSQQVSCKVCNVLGLLQCLALHPETRGLFLNAHIPLFLYPFLNTSSKSKPFENLRVTSLGVIGALVKGDDSDAIIFLMQTEIIPLCLRIMKRGQELSRTVATFIVQKILLDDNGLNYICQTAERFYAVCTVLNHMVTDVVTNSKDDQRLLRHVIRCYLRLAENPKAKEALRKNLPDPLREPDQKLISDEAVRKSHFQLLQSLGLIQTE